MITMECGERTHDRCTEVDWCECACHRTDDEIAAYYDADPSHRDPVGPGIRLSKPMHPDGTAVRLPKDQPMTASLEIAAITAVNTLVNGIIDEALNDGSDEAIKRARQSLVTCQSIIEVALIRSDDD